MNPGFGLVIALFQPRISLPKTNVWNLKNHLFQKGGSSEPNLHFLASKRYFSGMYSLSPIVMEVENHPK